MKRVLIVRLDAIGDYILFRNVLRFIRRSEKYREAQIAVFGNPAWRGIAEAFDSDCADEWIWADNRNDLFRKGYENHLPYCIWHRRVRKAQSVWRDRFIGRFDEVLSLQAFHDSLLDELVSGLAPVVVNGWRLPQGDSPFAFCRNRAIASALTDETCDVPLDIKLGGNREKTKDVLFFAGASHWTRRWPMKNWEALSKMLPAGYSPIYARTDGSLQDFLGRVSSSAAVVSNDTMAVHAAAALGVPVVAITNGTSGKSGFWPYPEELGKRYAAVVPEMVRLPWVVLGVVRDRLEQYMSLVSIRPCTVADSLRAVLNEGVS